MSSADRDGTRSATVRPRSLAILGSRGIPARYGGFETFAEELATRLVRAGFPVTVFCERREGEPAPAEHQGVRLVHLPGPRLGPLTTLVYDFRSLWLAREHDVVFMLGYGAALFCWLPRLFGREVWISMDGLEWRRRKWGRLARAWLRRMESRALRSATRVVFDSHAVRREVLEGGAEKRVRGEVSVIAYGARLDLEHDPLVLESLSLRPRSYYFVVCRIEPENHVLEIVRAFSRAPTTRALLVVGDLERAGGYGDDCRRAAGPQVRFLGPVFDRPTLHALRVECQGVIHGHSVGGTNPSLLEALAAGAPVVAHDNPFNREVLEDAALYFQDEESLLRALTRSEQRTVDERRLLAERGRRRIRERYTWEAIAQQYAALLDPEHRFARGVDPAPHPAESASAPSAPDSPRAPFAGNVGGPDAPSAMDRVGERTGEQAGR